MRFDNEEAFMKAVYNTAGVVPVEIANSMISAPSTSEERKVFVGIAVRLIRAAYAVHQRVTEGDEADGFHSLIGFRLEQASKQLPPEWRIVVTAQRGALQVDLYDPGDTPHPLEAKDKDVSNYVQVAIQRAAELDKRIPH